MKVVFNLIAPIAICLLFTFTAGAQSGPQCKPADCIVKDGVVVSNKTCTKADIAKCKLITSKANLVSVNSANPKCSVVSTCRKASSSLVSQEKKKVKPAAVGKKTKV